jgi:hypothetical protein
MPNDNTNPWGDAANQAVGAMYKYYMSQPNQAEIEANQLSNQLKAAQLEKVAMDNKFAPQLFQSQIDSQRSSLARNNFELQQKRKESEAASRFADAFGSIPDVRGPVPTDDTMGPVMPVTPLDRQNSMASLFEQYAPTLNKDTAAAARDALGTANALRFEDPIQRQLAIDEKATSYENMMPGFTLTPGAVRFGANNEKIASAPFKTGGGSYIQQPDGTVISIDGGAPPLRPNIQANLQGDQIASEKLKGLMSYTRRLANEDPLNFGFPGFVKGGVQDVTTLLGGVTSALGYEQPQQAVDAARRDILASGVDQTLFNGIFDPTLPALQTANDLLVYQAAAALAGQEGRDLSNADVKAMRKIVGNSTDWFTSQNKFLSKLDVLEQILNLNDQVTDRTLGGNVTGATNPLMGVAAPTGPVAIQSDADYESLPSGTQFIAPDGTTRIKP